MRGTKELPLLDLLYGIFASFSRASRDLVFALKGYPEGIASPVAGYSCDAVLSGMKISSDLNLKDSLMIAINDSLRIGDYIFNILAYPLTSLSGYILINPSG